MIINQFMEQIQGTYKKHFPNSKIFIHMSKLYPCVTFICCLANDKTEVFNGYWENDILSVRFTIDTEFGAFRKELTEESETPNNLRLTSESKSYHIKPENRYMAYGTRKLSFRKTIGNDAKILETLDKFFTKLHESLKNDLKTDMISENHKELVKSKL